METPIRDLYSYYAPMSMDQPDQRIELAGKELFRGLWDALNDARGVHLETAISGAGYLAGAALLAASGVNLSELEAGSYVIVDRVNESGPGIIQALVSLCAHAGLVVEAASMAESIPPGHEPRRDYLDLMRTLLPVFDRVVTERGIPSEMRPMVALYAAFQLILEGREQIDPSLGCAIAAQAIVKGAKTVPPT